MKSISEMYNEKVMTADQALDLIQAPEESGYE